MPRRRSLESRRVAASGFQKRLVINAVCLVSAMTILHAHNIVHRDLKPGNLLLHNLTAKADLSEFDLTLKIADYGLARHLSKPEIQGEQLLKTVLGTLVYTAPELLKARIEKKPGEYTAKVDMWSIGMILYNCATGRLPFTEEVGHYMHMMPFVVQATSSKGLSRMLRTESRRC